MPPLHGVAAALERIGWGRLGMSLLVPVAMLAIAGAAGAPQLIFPEGAALAFGVIALRIVAWREAPGVLLMAPASAAGVGVALARLSGPAWARELVALTAALVVLRLLRSRLAPVISAAMLPVVFGTRSWSFVGAVAAIGAVLAAFEAASRTRAVHSEPGGVRGLLFRGLGAAPTGPTVLGWVLVATWVVIAGPILHLPAAALAPPLFVATFEWLARSQPSAKVGLSQWSATIAAAGLGAALAYIIHPGWVGGCVAVTLGIAMLVVSSVPHPPALAVALIPQVAGAGHPVRFVAAVSLGSAALYTAASVVHHCIFSRRREAGVAE